MAPQCLKHRFEGVNEAQKALKPAGSLNFLDVDGLALQAAQRGHQAVAQAL
jgi:hypothetical protein